MGRGALPGWYGKLPALGDFASRRLPPLFVEPWDRWLASGLAHWRDADPGWLDAYLAAPVVHFALGAGVPFAHSPGYAGVLMPSLDRVGRYFPLTVARARDAGEARIPAGWLRAVEDVAVAAMQDDWDADRFDDELATIDDDGDAAGAWPDEGRAQWWCRREGAASAPAGTAGLPQGPDFARLLGGAF